MLGFGPGGFSTFQLMFAAVPLFMIAIAGWGLVSVARRRADANRIVRVGQRVQGKVITAYVGQSGSGDNRQTYIVETIEFMTLDGRTVRASPLHSDIGLTDRGGTYVTVVYDPEDPQRFVAPMNGQELRPRGNGARIGGAVFMIVFAVFFLVVSQSMIGFTSMFGDR